MGANALLNATPFQIKEAGAMLGVPDFDVVLGFPVVRGRVRVAGGREKLDALVHREPGNARELLRPYRRIAVPQRYRDKHCGACNETSIWLFASYCQVALELLFRGSRFRVDVVRSRMGRDECEVVFEEAG